MSEEGRALGVVVYFERRNYGLFLTRNTETTSRRASLMCLGASYNGGAPNGSYPNIILDNSSESESLLCVLINASYVNRYVPSRSSVGPSRSPLEPDSAMPT